MKTTLRIGWATDVGRVRRQNQDFVEAAQVGSADGRAWELWLVADGVGGGVAGEVASRVAVETVIAFLNGEPWTDPVAALRGAFTAADVSVFDITGTGEAATTLVAALVAVGQGRDGAGFECDGAGVEGDRRHQAASVGADPSTQAASEQPGTRAAAPSVDSAAAAFPAVAGGETWIANVGDSRAYLISGGEARQITTDHSLVAARVQAGVISAAEARVAPDRNVVTRAIGVDADGVADVFRVPPLLLGERLLLCTDGIHGMIEDDLIGRLASGPDPAAAAARLVEAANTAGGRDNSTAFVGGPVLVEEPAVVAGSIPKPADIAGPGPDSRARR